MLLFPVISKSSVLDGYKYVYEEFEVQNKDPESYKDLLNIPNDLVDQLPTSFDCIGDIILIKISSELERYKEDIGVALLKAQKHAQTVIAIEPVSGELRVRSVEIIAGVNKTETVHTEYGLQMLLDVSDTYFSPRLASERKRIASLVKDDEVIVDLFTGVAPFPLMIATYAHPKKIIAIDKNPIAVEYAKKNIMRNDLLDIIDVFEADAEDAELLLDTCGLKADRVIMNLPFDSFRFLPIAFSILSSFGMIHFYEIIKEACIDERIGLIKKSALDHGYSIIKVNVRKIKTYAPHEFYIGIDITVKKIVDADVA